MSTPATIARTVTRLSWKLVPLKPSSKSLAAVDSPTRRFSSCSTNVRKGATADIGRLEAVAGMHRDYT